MLVVVVEIVEHDFLVKAGAICFGRGRTLRRRNAWPGPLGSPSAG